MVLNYSKGQMMDQMYNLIYLVQIWFVLLGYFKIDLNKKTGRMYTNIIKKLTNIVSH